MNHLHTWILVADGGSAKILQYESAHKPILQVNGATFDHQHALNHEFVSSDRGRASNGNRVGRHALEWPTDPHRYEKKLFAKELVAYLTSHQHDFERLVLIAPPEMMGNIRDQFSASLRHKLYAEETKDLTRVSLHHLPKHLKDILNVQLRAN